MSARRTAVSTAADAAVEAKDPATRAAGPAAGDGPDHGVAAMGYEQARDELVDVVRRLEGGSATLEESLALWERGEGLARRCEQWLDGAQTRLDEAVTRRRPADGGGPGDADA